MRVYSVYDKVAKNYNGLFLARNHACAVRMFKSGGDKVNLNDFSLWCLGTFDDETGRVAPIELLEVSLSEYDGDESK